MKERISPVKDLRNQVEESARFTDLLHIFSDKQNASLALGPQDASVFQNKIRIFVESLNKKYGEDEVMKRQLFHVIVNSGGMDYRTCPEFDFTGEDSIERFIHEL
jgi:hypothetical protein